jgi:hypothetical protein
VSRSAWFARFVGGGADIACWWSAAQGAGHATTVAPGPATGKTLAMLAAIVLDGRLGGQRPPAERPWNPAILLAGTDRRRRCSLPDRYPRRLPACPAGAGDLRRPQPPARPPARPPREVRPVACHQTVEQAAADRHGFTVPCPTLLPTPAPNSNPPAVCERRSPWCTPTFGFLLEVSRFVVSPGYPGLDPAGGAHLAIAAARRTAGSVACVEERPVATVKVRGTSGRISLCPRAPGATVHYGSVLPRWRDGVRGGRRGTSWVCCRRRRPGRRSSGRSWGVRGGRRRGDPCRRRPYRR